MASLQMFIKCKPADFLYAYSEPCYDGWATRHQITSQSESIERKFYIPKDVIDAKRWYSEIPDEQLSSGFEYNDVLFLRCQKRELRKSRLFIAVATPAVKKI